MGPGGAHPVRPLIGYVAAVACKQVELDRPRREALVEFQVAVPGHRALDPGIVDDGAVGLLSIEARTERERAAHFEVLLLPLTHTRETVDRVLGAMTACSDEPWLGHEPLITRRLVTHEIIWPEGRPHAIAQARDRQLPFVSHIRHARIVRSDRRHFRVYNGGLSRSDRD